MNSSIALREQLQNKLEAVGKGALSAEDRAAIADAAFAQEEEDVAALEATLRKTREIHFKKKQVHDSSFSMRFFGLHDAFSTASST